MRFVVDAPCLHQAVSLQVRGTISLLSINVAKLQIQFKRFVLLFQIHRESVVSLAQLVVVQHIDVNKMAASSLIGSNDVQSASWARVERGGACSPVTFVCCGVENYREFIAA